jgi:hypothetical protein
VYRQRNHQSADLVAGDAVRLVGGAGKVDGASEASASSGWSPRSLDRRRTRVIPTAASLSSPGGSAICRAWSRMASRSRSPLGVPVRRLAVPQHGVHTVESFHTPPRPVDAP